MNRTFPTMALICLTLALGGCGSLSHLGSRLASVSKKLIPKKADKSNPDEKSTGSQSALADKNVGEVSYVDEESKFILIRQAPSQKVPPNTPLVARNAAGQVTASLMASPASKGSFMAADIISGNPERGNFVLVSVDANPKPEAPPKTQSQSTAQSGPTPKTNNSYRAPKLEPILPPLEPLAPPTSPSEPLPPAGDIEAPPLPKLEP